jgi:hypothetical protein
MASKSDKRRRKRRLVHQGVVPTDERAAGGSGEASAVPADTSATAAEPSGPATPAKAAPAKRKGPRRGERNIDDDRPPAPWGNFPLVEIAVFIGLVMVILGFLVISGDRKPVFVIVGLSLASIGGLELAIREHFAGFRSHTLILAGAPAAIVLAILFYAGPAGLPQIARAGIAAVVFGIAALLLIRVFRDRSGGRAFRFSAFRPPR